MAINCERYPRSQGFPVLNDNDYLVTFIPATKTSLVFRVVTRANNYPNNFYGAIPFTAGETLPTYDGGSVAVPAAGVLPARAYTATGKSFPLTGASDVNDMFYTNEEYRDRIFHIVGRTTPDWLRLGLEYPKGVKQYRYQRDNVILGIDKNFGFGRGVIETVQFPNIRQGWLFGNDTNMPVYTGMNFQYEELIIETPKDPVTIHDVLSGKQKAHRIDLPISVQDPSLQIALKKDYGYYGFDTTLIKQKDRAIASYAAQIKELIV
jgi:hypothetical protein